jgi:hypothetical protein
LEPSPEESKGQNDLPQLQNRDGESGTWAKQCAAVEVPAVRPAIL